MITVLYEDQLASGRQPNQYPLHLLVIQCVADRLGYDGYWNIKEVEPIPCNGRDKLLRRLREGRAYRVGPVVAVLDDDRIRDADPALAGACKPQVAQWLRDPVRCPTPSRLTLVLLVDKLESVLDAVLACQGHSIPPQKPNPAERDVHLQSALARSALGQQVRKCVVDTVPSFGYLVSKIAALVS